MAVRIECPECATSYAAKRLGLVFPSDPTKGIQGTVLCLVCQKSFDFTIDTQVTEVRELEQGWVEWIFRRPKRTQDIFDWVATSRKRGE